MKALVIGFIVAASISCSAADGLCLRHLVVPSYPSLAVQAQIHGSVALDLVVAPNGEVTSVSSSGAHKMLRQAAEENMRTWMFCSGLAAQNVHVTYTYRLEGEERYPVPPPKINFDLPEKIEIVSHPPTPET